MINQVVNDNTLGSNTNGTTANGNQILVKDSQSKSSTGAHEMGHTLGLEHSSSGLMTTPQQNTEDQIT